MSFLARVYRWYEHDGSVPIKNPAPVSPLVDIPPRKLRFCKYVYRPDCFPSMEEYNSFYEKWLLSENDPDQLVSPLVKQNYLLSTPDLNCLKLPDKKVKTHGKPYLACVDSTNSPINYESVSIQKGKSRFSFQFPPKKNHVSPNPARPSSFSQSPTPPSSFSQSPAPPSPAPMPVSQCSYVFQQKVVNNFSVKVAHKKAIDKKETNNSSFPLTGWGSKPEVVIDVQKETNNSSIPLTGWGSKPEVVIDVQKETNNSSIPLTGWGSNQNEDTNNNEICNDYQLTNQDFETAFKLHINHKNWSFNYLQKNLSFVTGHLKIKDIDPNKFKSMCQLAFASLRGSKTCPVTETKLNNVDLYIKQANFLSKPKNVMTQHVPGELCNIGPWSELETNSLLNFLLNVGAGQFRAQNGGIDWSCVSRFVPGRNGSQCKKKFYDLKSEGLLVDFNFDEYKFSRECQLKQISALDEEEEMALFEEISKEIDEQNIVTKSTIANAAFKIYYQPISLVRKALKVYFTGRNVYDAMGVLKPEFIDEYNQKFNEFFLIAKDEPQLLIERFNIKNFIASMSWVCRFMKRHDLVFRCAHYERRGAIQQDWVEKYITQVAKAIAHYGTDRVLNMDETHVKIDNFTNKVICHKGQESVSVISNHCNKTEGFTVMATCSETQKFPLIVIAKGKTERCTTKFKITGEVQSEFFKSMNGWTTVSIMNQYLRWISAQMGGEPFALIVDCFKAHLNDEVKELAKELKIELIIVPACGTGLYQPLDRKIFGIVKAKLRANENHKGIVKTQQEEKTRYSNVCRLMEEVWKEISDKALQSAWNIPGLKKLMALDKESSENKKDGNYKPNPINT